MTSSAADLLRLLRQREAMTRAELLEATGLSRSTLGPRLDRLVELRLVVTESAPSTGGRPPSRFAFNPRAGVVLAADLGATHGRLAVADLTGTTLASTSIEVAIADGPDSVLERVLATFDSLLEQSGHQRADVWSTALGLPGPVDVERGRPVRPPIMPGWDDFDVRGWFAGRIPGPVFVDNDVNVIALGEYWHTWHPEVSDVLHVKVATGIGAGLVADGRVFRGARGAAGDIGHIRVESPRVVICDCGNENCLEAVASGRALARDQRDAGYETHSTRDVVELVTAGNPDAVHAVRTAGRRLGEALAAAVNLLNPEVIVVSGDLVGAHEHLLAGVREVIYQRSTALATQSLRIDEGRLADDAGIEGCIVLALEALLATDAIDEFVDGTGSTGAIA